MREVYGVRIEQETYAVVRSLLQCVSKNTKADLEVAISLITMENVDFIKSRNQLEELVVVLEKITGRSKNDICDAITQHYEQNVSVKSNDIKETVEVLKQYFLDVEQHQLQQEQEKAQAVTPIKRTYTRRSVDSQASAGTLAQKLQRYKFSAEYARNPYQQQLNDCAHAYSKPLQSNFLYTQLMYRLQQHESQVLNGNQGSFLYKGNKLSFFHTSMCQYPQALYLLVAPANNFLPKLKAIHGNGAMYLGSQVDITYSNEAHDEADINFAPKEYYQWLERYRKDPQIGIYNFITYTISTKKPTPQHHSLIDITGCYVNKQQIYESITTHFAVLCHKSKKDTVRMIDILFYLSKIKFFAPFQFFADQNAYGNEARYIRFVADSRETTYLKAVGIGGGVRLQVHCAKDILKDEEITLRLQNYFCCRQGSLLYKKMARLVNVQQQLDYLINTQPWDDEIARYANSKNQEHYHLLKDAARATFLTSYMQSQFAEFMEEVPLAALQAELRGSLRGAGPVEAGNRDLLFLECGEGVSVLGQGATEEPAQHQFYNTVVDQLLTAGHLGGPERIEALLDAIPDMGRYLHNFLQLRYYDYQQFGAPGGARARAEAGPAPEAKKRGRKAKYGTLQNISQKLETQSLVDQVKRLLAEQPARPEPPQDRPPAEPPAEPPAAVDCLPCRVYIKQHPCYYTNYRPFQDFRLFDYPNFDKFVLEKIYLESFNFVKSLVLDAAGLPEPELDQVLLRFVHQNRLFSRQALGQQVDCAQYAAHTAELVCDAGRPLYQNIVPLMYQLFDLRFDALARYCRRHARGHSFDRRVLARALDDTFNGPQDPAQSQGYRDAMFAPLQQRQRDVFDRETTRALCEHLYQFLQHLPPLSKKLKIDHKKLIASRQTRLAAPGSDGFCGWEAELAVNGLARPGAPRGDGPRRPLFGSDAMQACFQTLRLCQNDGAELKQRAQRVVSRHEDTV